MTNWRRVSRLARTLVAAETDASGRSLMLYPIGFGLLFVGLTALAATTPSALTGTTQHGLTAALDRHFTSVSGPRFAVALVVVQGPVLLAMFAAVVATPTAQSLVGRRTSRGAFETLLAAPYAYREVFLALVAAAFALAVGQTLVLAVVGVGGSWAVLLAAGSRFTVASGPILYAPYLVPLSVTLWAALVATTVFMVYPETALSGAGTGNLLLLVALLPAFVLLGLTTSAVLSPVVVAAGGFLGVTLLTGAGVVAIRHWFRPARLL